MTKGYERIPSVRAILIVVRLVENIKISLPVTVNNTWWT
jgi:hypothetical protein